MSNTIKKISAIGLSLTTVMCLSGAAMALPIVALGVTTDELQAQITTLLAQIQALQTQLTAAQGATTVSYNFTKDLTLGSTGDDVKALQQFLNANGYAVAQTGVGSAGNETTYFGSLTQAALAKYQAAVGISPTAGYFGAKTRAYLASVAVVPTTTFPAGCTSATGFSTTTGLSCAAAVVTFPAGCTSAVGFSSTTGLSCSGTTAITGMSGNQGTMDVKLAAYPASGEDLYEAETGQAIYGIEAKASDSEIYVSRVKLQFNTAINNIINKVGLYRDGVLLAEKVINSDAVTRITSTNYTTQLTGFESKIDKGTTATFIVKVDALSSVDSAYTSFTVLAPAGALRAVDGAGITVGESSAALSANTVNVEQGGASAAILTISKNASSPDESFVAADSAGRADKVTLLIMNVKAEKDTVKLTDLTAYITGTATATTAYLYDGTTLVDSATITAGTVTSTFADFSFTVPKDTTKQLTLKADFTEVSTIDSVASSTVTTDDTLVVAEGSDGIALVAANKTESANGSQIHLLTIAPVFTLTSATVTATRPAFAGDASTTAAVNLKFTVKALGGDIIVSSTDAINVVPYLSGIATATALTEAYTITGATYDGTDLYTIAQDGTATFEVAGTLSMVSGAYAAGNYNFRITGFKWYPGAITETRITTAFLDDLSANPFITPIIYLP